MNIKRVLTTIIGLPLVIIIITFGNKYLIDTLIAIVAIMTIHEYFKALKPKIKPVEWMGYLAGALIAFIHVIKPEMALKVIGLLIPTCMTVLFLKVITSEMKTNIVDIAVTFFGIFYIVIFLAFVPIIRQMNNGYLLIWCLFIAAWGTDIFAYIFGKTIGKHKFGSISPNKTIEGCIGGCVGSVLLMLIYVFLCNTFLYTNFDYIIVIFVAVLLSIIGQIGDFAASSIKRYAEIKDFSNLIPGHGRNVR